MGFLGFGRKNNEVRTVADLILDGAENSVVIVPDHAKPVNAVQEIKPLASKKNIFSIESVYDVGGEVVLSGFVESGFIKKRMRTKIKDKEFLIRDVKTGTVSVKELQAGSQGTIFLKGKGIHFLRCGDVLEFKEKK